MYGQRLSKEEIDMLLLGICEGRLTNEPAGKPKELEHEVETYSLSTLERVNPVLLPGLDLLNHNISLGAAVALAEFIGRAVDVVYEGVEAKEYGSFLRSIEPVNTGCVFALVPLSGCASLIMEPAAAGMLIDAYFGAGEPYKQTSLTFFASLSQATLRKAEARLIDVIRKGWERELYFSGKGIEALLPFERGGGARQEQTPDATWGAQIPPLGGFEASASQRHLIADAERVYVSSFTLNISGFVGRFYITVPVDTINPLRDRFSNTCNEQERPAWAAGMVEGLYDAPVDITVEMGTVDITVEDLLSLKAGDIIETDRRVKEPVDVLLNGRPLLKALPGALGSRYAIRITGANVLAGQNEFL